MRATRGSGSNPRYPGDNYSISVPVLIEDKYTQSDKRYLTFLEWNDHARKAKYRQGRIPVWKIGIKGGGRSNNVAVLSHADWCELAGESEGGSTRDLTPRARSLRIDSALIAEAVRHDEVIVTGPSLPDGPWVVIHWDLFERAYKHAAEE